MDEEKFIDSLEDLTGRVAIVTGGAAGIGLETTIYLARKGATVYIASRNQQKSEAAISKARERLQDRGGSIKFHLLDLASIQGAGSSADAFQQLETRLDIIICNAGILAFRGEVSKDGYDKAFATNHLGHFRFVTKLQDLLEKTARVHGQARVVMTSSMGYKMAPKMDYDALLQGADGGAAGFKDVHTGFTRYATSKLANIYFAAELDRRLQERGIHNIYCNSCHPGISTTTGLGVGEKLPFGPTIQQAMRSVLSHFTNSIPDTARTQVYLAASREIAERSVHGEYWQPTWSWRLQYTGCTKVKLTVRGADEQEQKKLWLFSEKAVADACG